MNKFRDKDVNLRSLSLAGNDLESANSAQQLVDTLENLFSKPFLQHLDLSLTGIASQEQTAKGVWFPRVFPASEKDFPACLGFPDLRGVSQAL